MYAVHGGARISHYGAGNQGDKVVSHENDCEMSRFNKNFQAKLHIMYVYTVHVDACIHVFYMPEYTCTCIMHVHVGMPELALGWFPLGLGFGCRR